MKTESRNKLDEKLSDALSRAVLSETESSFTDRDAFQNWLEEGARRQLLARRRKIRRIGLAAAAVFLCAVLLTGSLLLADALPPSLQALLSPEEGVAVPDFNFGVESGNGNVVIGGDGNGNTGTWTATFASYDEIPEKYLEQIIWFEEMPEGYELENVTIMRGIQRIEFTSEYSCEKRTVFRVKQIRYYQDVDNINVMNGYDNVEIIHGMDVYRKKADAMNSYAFFLDNNAISLLDTESLNKKQIEAIIASIRTDWNMR